MEPDLLPQREHLGDRLPPRALRHGRVPGIAAAASAPVDVGTAQALAVAMPMAFGAAIGCVALFLLRESRFGQVQEAWSGVFKAPDSGK